MKGFLVGLIGTIIILVSSYYFGYFLMGTHRDYGEIITNILMGFLGIIMVIVIFAGVIKIYYEIFE